jgi:UPF0755 protein
VAEDLQRAGLIRSSVQFLAIAEAAQAAKDLQAGTYQLRKTMTPREILGALSSGATRRPDLVTIAEGWRAEEVGVFLESRGVVSASEFAATVVGAPNGPPLPTGASNFEGYLFPDTYEFKPGSTADSVLRTLLAQFDRALTPQVRADAALHGLTIHQLVTLASIVEREAVEPGERARVAAVLHNRLDVGMALEADPTVQYALLPFGTLSSPAGFWKAPLSVADLEVNSRYNTYIYNGLPPGPICSPGFAALEAAANPEDGPWLFFMARGDGSHAFAATFQEHLSNVARFGGPR